jgi:hypothetical protein
MRCEGEKTYDKPGRCPVCQMKLKPVADAPAPAKLRLELDDPKPSDIQPLKAADLALKLVSSDKAEAPKSLTGTQVHVFIASEGLSWFDCKNATVDDAAVMKVRVEFPHAGGFVIFADPEAPSQPVDIASLTLTVPGEAPASVMLKPDEAPRRLADGYSVTLDKHDAIRAGSPATLAFAISRDDKAVSDLEPYFGSPGHLVLISQDLTRLVHVRASGVRGHDHGPAAPANGPDLTFDATLPAPGIYRAWLQFQHRGTVLTAPFTFEVNP